MRSGNGNSAAIKSAVQTALARERKRQKKDSDDVQEMAELIANTNLSNTSNTTSTAGAANAVTDAHMHAATKLLEKRNSIKKRKVTMNTE